MKSLDVNVSVVLHGGKQHVTHLRLKTSEEVSYCPHCGSKGSVWVEDDPGDYYCGPGHYCATCGYQFMIQGSDVDEVTANSYTGQVLAALKRVVP